jgi:hypothetical protein
VLESLHIVKFDDCGFGLPEISLMQTELGVQGEETEFSYGRFAIDDNDLGGAVLGDFRGEEPT